MRRWAVTPLAILAVVAPAAWATEPEAPASFDAIVGYHDSGEWDADASAVVDDASEFLIRHLEDDASGRPAVVLDVDDTSLSSYACLKRLRFVRSRARCAESGRMPPVPQTLELYREARARGVTVVFLTGRRQRLRAVTARNLRRAGYGGRLRIVLRPNRERPGTHDGFKARQRRKLARDGYTIVLNVGDQQSDLTGGSALGRFKLPNPMYLIRTA